MKWLWRNTAKENAIPRNQKVSLHWEKDGFWGVSIIKELNDMEKLARQDSFWWGQNAKHNETIHTQWLPYFLLKGLYGVHSKL